MQTPLVHPTSGKPRNAGHRRGAAWPSATSEGDTTGAGQGEPRVRSYGFRRESALNCPLLTLHGPADDVTVQGAGDAAPCDLRHGPKISYQFRNISRRPSLHYWTLGLYF